MSNMRDYTEATVLDELARQGFTEQFAIEDGAVSARKSGRTYDTAQLHVASTHRFEGESAPGDQSIVFALETHDGVRGTLVSGFGPATARADIEVIRALSLQRDPAAAPSPTEQR